MTVPPATTLPWNLVTKNLHGHELLRKKILEKITKLERHLKHFPPGTVHLHIALERHSKKKLFTATLTLRVPSNILQSVKSAHDVIQAFDDAVKVMLGELETLKSRLRKERLWKREARHEELHQLKASGFAPEPMPEGTGPQNVVDVVQEFLKQQYDFLVRHVERRIRNDELAGDVPRGALNVRDIVDEVARQVEASTEQKPKEMGWLLWIYYLIHQEIRRQQSALKRKRETEVSLDDVKRLPPEPDEAEGYDAEQPLEIFEQEFQPRVIWTQEVIPDSHAAPPDLIVAQKDLMAQLQNIIGTFSRAERELFEFYFVEGLEPEEIAAITEQPLQKIQANLNSIQHRLRELMLDLVLL